MKADKKAVHGSPRFVLLEGIGKTKCFENKYSFGVSDENLAKAIGYLNEND